MKITAIAMLKHYVFLNTKAEETFLPKKITTIFKNLLIGFEDCEVESLV